MVNGVGQHQRGGPAVGRVFAAQPAVFQIPVGEALRRGQVAARSRDAWSLEQARADGIAHRQADLAGIAGRADRGVAGGNHLLGEEQAANGAELERLNKAGFLRLAFLIISSLGNVSRLIELKNRKRAAG